MTKAQHRIVLKWNMLILWLYHSLFIVFCYHYIARVFLLTVPSASDIYIFVKIKKTKIAKPCGFNPRSVGPSWIFSVVLYSLSHEDISVWDSLIIQVMTGFNYVRWCVGSLMLHNIFLPEVTFGPATPERKRIQLPATSHSLSLSIRCG